MPRTLPAEEQPKVVNAWKRWQSEESRDRGYDFDLCQRLRRDFYRALQEARNEEAQANG